MSGAVLEKAFQPGCGTRNASHPVNAILNYASSEPNPD